MQERERFVINDYCRYLVASIFVKVFIYTEFGDSKAHVVIDIITTGNCAWWFDTDAQKYLIELLVDGSK